MEINLKNHKAGYPGHDAMRSKAEALMSHEMKGPDNERPSKSAGSQLMEKRRLYAKGGHAHGGVPRSHIAKHSVVKHKLNDGQTNEHFPKAKPYAKGGAVARDSKGRYAAGGMALGGMNPQQQMPMAQEAGARGFTSGTQHMTPSGMQRMPQMGGARGNMASQMPPQVVSQQQQPGAPMRKGGHAKKSAGGPMVGEHKVRSTKSKGGKC